MTKKKDPEHVKSANEAYKMDVLIAKIGEQIHEGDLSREDEKAGIQDELEGVLLYLGREYVYELIGKVMDY